MSSAHTHLNVTRYIVYKRRDLVIYVATLERACRLSHRFSKRDILNLFYINNTYFSQGLLIYYTYSNEFRLYSIIYYWAAHRILTS